MSNSDHPLWQRDHIELTSVGIDVGSATTQVLFSQLELHRVGRELSSRYAVVSRKVVYRSPMHLTPYAEGLRINEHGLRLLVHEAFADAGIASDEVHTGAIILTGEATRRENSRAIADVFAEESGVFVCATAGHQIEATLAAHGSGAVADSGRDRSRILNIDIGGGTTKFAVVERGKIVRTAALHAGGRLVAVDEQRRVVRLEPAGRRLAELSGVEWQVGALADEHAMQLVADRMVEMILTVAMGKPYPQALADLMLTEALPSETYDAVLLSGGVSEYVYQREERSFGDLGPMLGRALAARAAELPGPLVEGGGGIRATVIGASQYTVQVSGNTIFISDPADLPLQNLQVVNPGLELSGEVAADNVAAGITRHLAQLGVDIHDRLAFAFRWQGAPSFQRLDALVDGIEQALKPRLARGGCLCLLFEGDVARTVGTLFHERYGTTTPVVSIDGIAVTDFEFIDIGSILSESGTVPISIKSLMFHL